MKDGNGLLQKKMTDIEFISFKELEDSDLELPSIFAEKKYLYTKKEKEEVLKYLRNGEVVLAAPSVLTDVFTGKKTGQNDYTMTDGDVYWPSILAYYVEKYEVCIPKDFKEKIMAGKMADRTGRQDPTTAFS